MITRTSAVRRYFVLVLVVVLLIWLGPFSCPAASPRTACLYHPAERESGDYRYQDSDRGDDKLAPTKAEEAKPDRLRRSRPGERRACGDRAGEREHQHDARPVATCAADRSDLELSGHHAHPAGQRVRTRLRGRQVDGGGRERRQVYEHAELWYGELRGASAVLLPIDHEAHRPVGGDVQHRRLELVAD